MAHDDVDDWIALARRGELDEPEARRLEMVLKTSDATRAFYEVGASFDATLTGRPGDEALLARVRDRVTARVATQPLATQPLATAPPRKHTRKLLAFALLVAGAAAASVVGVQTLTARRQTQATASLPPGTGASTAAALRPAAPAQPEPSARMDEHVGRNEPRATSSAPPDAPDAGPRPPHPVSAPELTARELFVAGNAARKSGAQASALSTYRKLQQAFPGSPEARVSRVLSGRMLLGMGRTDAALAQFDRYLAGGSQGGLAEEALWGKAQALSRLGRTGDEQRVWRILLERFPKSVYATTARQRLER